MEKVVRKKTPDLADITTWLSLLTAYDSERSIRGGMHSSDLERRFAAALKRAICARFSDPKRREKIFKTVFSNWGKAIREYTVDCRGIKAKEISEASAERGVFTFHEKESEITKNGSAAPQTPFEITDGEWALSIYREALKKANRPYTPPSQAILDLIVSNIYKQINKEAGMDTYLAGAINYAYYYKYRKQVASWIHQACSKKYDAFLVNAPLGLGKTMAIASALKANKDKSAIIFMPMVRLCKALYDLFDPRECYLIEGVGEDNCPFFKKVVRKYKELDYGKGDICDMCRKKECKIRSQYNEARKYRIVITTHQQYPRFYSIPRERYWEGHGLRDFFIIDENIIANNFMSSVKVRFGEMNRDLGAIINCGIDFDYPVKEKLRLLRGRIQRSWQSAFIAPIDRNFAPTKGDSIRAGKAIGKLKESDVFVRKLRHLYFWAIKNGCVTGHGNVGSDEGADYLAYFYRPVSYELNLWDPITKERVIPAHVFFDATSMNKDVFKNYFPRARLKEIEIDVPALGELRIHHTNVTNLPRMSDSSSTNEKIKNYLEYIFKKHGDKTNYFALTRAGESERFVRMFFREKNIHLKGTEEAKRSGKGYLVTCHYGDQKGINDAQECAVGIMLGTYFRPTEAILVNCLPYINTIIRRDCQIKGKICNVDPKRGFYYYPRFHTVGKMDYWLRTIEHEQGMGRTRHLYHDVDFYVVTRDPVNTYSISKWATYELDKKGNEIFARKKSSLWRGADYKKAALELIALNGFFAPKGVAAKLGVSEKAVTNWIRETVDIVKIRHGKYKIMS